MNEHAECGVNAGVVAEAARANFPPLFDMHCHILPEVDDGPQSLDETLAMAKFYVADGVTCVVATPHCHRYVHLLRREILPAVIRLNEHLRARAIPLTVLPGSEIQVVNAAEYRREFEEDVYCHLGDGQEFTLLEFNWNRELFPSDAAELVKWIRDHGMRPILAHPERYVYFSKEMHLLDRMVEAGAWLQVTVDSLLGNHGPAPAVAGVDILRRHREVVLATDAHNLNRCSGMAAGFQWVRRELGDERADDLYRRGEVVRERVESVGRVDA